MKRVLMMLLAAAAVLSGCASAPESAAPGAGVEYGTHEEKVMIDAGDHQIPAIVSVPVSEGKKFPAVVMLHGYGSDKDSLGVYSRLAPELAKKGIASVRFDFMGNGDSTVDHAGFNLNVGVAETMAAADYMCKQPNINAKKIGILGWSKGGTLALLSAGRNPLFKSVVTWAGAVDLTSAVYTDKGYEVAKKDGVYTETFDWRPPLNLSLEAFEISKNTDVLAEFAKSKAPVMAITGDADTTVPPENATLIKNDSKNPKSKLVVIPGGDHTLNVFTGDMTVSDKVISETVAWFVDTL